MANNVVTVGIIGCGGFQRYRLSNLSKVKEAKVVALVDPDPDQIQKTIEAYPQLAECPVFEDYRQMLKEVKPDAVMIATPHTQHVDQIVDSFEAGAHVCCEKPLVTTVKDAHRVIEARDKANKVGLLSYQRHYQPEYRYIRSKIQSGEAGKVQFVSAIQEQGWLKGTSGTWRQKLSLSGGGQLNDSASHLLDVILWVTALQPASICAFSDNFGTEVDINSTLAVKFKNGAQASLGVVGNGFGWYEDVSIVCENMVFYMRANVLTMVDRQDNRFKAEHLSGGSTPDQNFIDAILGRAECESPFECGLEVIRLTEAAWKSAAADGAPAVVVPNPV